MYMYSEVMTGVFLIAAVSTIGTWFAVSLIKGGKDES